MVYFKQKKRHSPGTDVMDFPFTVKKQKQPLKQVGITDEKRVRLLCNYLHLHRECACARLCAHSVCLSACTAYSCARLQLGAVQ